MRRGEPLQDQDEQSAMPPDVAGPRTPRVLLDSQGRMWTYGRFGLRRYLDAERGWEKVELPGSQVVAMTRK